MGRSSTTEYCSIHPESDDRPWIQARLWDVRDVRNLGLMCERVHETRFAGRGGAEFQRFRITAGMRQRPPSPGVSQLPSPEFVMSSCYEMDKHDIRELQGFYVAAAKGAPREAGFDLVLVYGAETIGIPQQFLMPYFKPA